MIIATIATAGLVVAVKLLNDVDTPTPFTYIALGKGVGVESSADTALGTECTEAGLTRAATGGTP